MIPKENVPLAQYTTFKIGGPARFFCAVSSEAELLEAVTFAHHEKLRMLILGGGSNVLISDAGFPGLVIKNEILGKKILPGDDGDVGFSIGAGEMWDEIVQLAVESGLYGIENLSAIPGTVGAAPVQNIGAYGSEIADSIISLRALDTETMKYVELPNEKCDFGYRDSIFKHRKGRYIITQVNLKLSKNGTVNISYKDLKEYFNKTGSKNTLPTLKEVRDAVTNIRWNKLPDWKLWGTAGSFFKNPIVTKAYYEKLKEKYPELPGYPEPNECVKIPLGWVLDHICHVKGHMSDNVGPYKNQALVIVAKPGATASQIVAYAQELMAMVERDTGIIIEAEVEWVN
ncbi:MAG: UDP-N-acetylmuramate dehydrogenase [Candidatus Taylorbacteria bacterium]|nr:UDP-N-acetylmuramate dehydrogenase [Candidatus Taylorbacteria bacterium]